MCAKISECVTVTAYFKRPSSKHSHNNYLMWMQNMLCNIQSTLVIFTDAETEPLIRRLREKAGMLEQTIIIPTEFEDLLTMSSKYREVWQQHFSLDPENNIHTPDLYAIWNEKFNLVRRAKAHIASIPITESSSYPEYYIWMDIGSFRCRPGDITKEMIRYWPDRDLVRKRIPGGKASFLLVGEFDDAEKKLIPVQAYPPVHVPTHVPCPVSYITEKDLKYKMKSIGGTFVLPTSCVDVWCDRFYSTLDAFISYGRFAGKDQNIMSSMALAFEGDVHLIRPGCVGQYDLWFYLHIYLHPVTKHEDT